ncbi:UDP-glucuronic acid decarboxylase 4 [Dionaea muscipula]
MHHFGNSRFEMIRHDVVEPLLLEVDQIYHLACPASPVHYKHNPVKTIISFLFLIFVLQLNFFLQFSFPSHFRQCCEVV